MPETTPSLLGAPTFPQDSNEVQALIENAQRAIDAQENPMTFINNILNGRQDASVATKERAASLLKIYATRQKVRSSIH